MKQLTKPAKILDMDRVVQTVLFTQRLKQRRVCRHVWRDKIVDRICAGQFDAAENQRTDDQQHRDHHE